MNTLSGLDASFLYLETPETPMHIGSFCLYERPADQKGSFHAAIKKHIAKRLHLAPIFTQKLALMPLELGHPSWVACADIDLNRHIQQVKGKALTVREAEAHCAGLHSQLMDRTRPLWEFHVFERIKRPDGSVCAGLYSKVHHAALDGKGGTVLTQAILDISATPREVAPPSASASDQPPNPPGRLAMLGEVISGSVSQYKGIFKAIPQVAKALTATLSKPTGAPPDGQAPRKLPMQLAPMTDFNVAVSTQRSFATAQLSFAECRAIGKAVGASFNDVVLWLCSTALRTYLAHHGNLPPKSLLAAMPISLREEGNQDLNTQASMTVVALGTHLEDPLQRLAAIQASTHKVKTARTDLKGLIPTDYPSLLAPWLVGGLAKAAYKTYTATGLSHRLPMPANLVISNVPGPPIPLYLAGAKLLTFHPLSIVTHGLALNITIQTYAGQVDFGIVADPQALPHAQELSDALTQAFEEARTMLAAPTSPAPKRVTQVTRPRKTPAKSALKPATSAPKTATVKKPTRRRTPAAAT
jgi:diacylglycerol O-acyltransferase / wax synthase